MNDLKYIFGPVPSRRLGRSLGINIVPSKICSMDCIYCEVGKTNSLTMKKAPYYKAENILQEVKCNIAKFDNMIDVITITGAGEPTLNSELVEIVNGIRKLTDKKIAILTNTSLITDNEVYEALLSLDIVVPSLDAIDPISYNAINKPHHDIDIDSIIDTLQKFSKEFKGQLFLEVLICKGINDSDDDILRLISTLRNINATKVQISTTYRPPAYIDTVALSDDELLAIVTTIRKAGIKVEIAGAFKKVYQGATNGDERELVSNLISMRPCTMIEIESVIGIDNVKLRKILDSGTENGSTVINTHNGEDYYFIQK